MRPFNFLACYLAIWHHTRPVTTIKPPNVNGNANVNLDVDSEFIREMTDGVVKLTDVYIEGLGKLGAPKIGKQTK